MALKFFARTKELENWIDEFLDTLSESSISFKMAVRIYLSEGCNGSFYEKLEQVERLESKGDDLRRSILTEMYSELLLPDFRGDVLQLLESLDRIINKLEEVLWYFRTERPEIPEALKSEYANLSDLAVQSVEALVLASRAFFRDADSVKDHKHKVIFYEHEADIAVTHLRTNIFDTDLPLAEKIHLRFFAERIVWISDMAEDVADDLTIYAIKRVT